MEAKDFRGQLTEALENADDLGASAACVQIASEWLVHSASMSALRKLMDTAQWQAAQLILVITASLNVLQEYSGQLVDDWPSLGLSDYGRDEIDRLSAKIRDAALQGAELRSRCDEMGGLTGSVESTEADLVTLRGELTRLKRLTNLTSQKAALQEQLKKLRSANNEALKVSVLEQKCEKLARDVCTMQQECLEMVSTECASALLASRSAATDMRSRLEMIRESKEEYRSASEIVEEMSPIQRLYFAANQKIAERLGTSSLQALLDRIDDDLKALDEALKIAIVANEECQRLNHLIPVAGPS